MGKKGAQRTGHVKDYSQRMRRDYPEKEQKGAPGLQMKEDAMTGRIGR